MNFLLERVTVPEIEPVSLVEMKRHLRIDIDLTEEDDDIEALVVAAREWVESYTGRALIDQTWRLTLTNVFSLNALNLTGSGFVGVVSNPANGILLRRSPIISITSAASVDSNGDETEIDAADFQLRDANTKWPTIGGIVVADTTRIVYRAGFANRSTSPIQGTEVVPVRFKQAIKLWVEANYDRDDRMMKVLLETAEKIIRPERADLQLC